MSDCVNDAVFLGFFCFLESIQRVLQAFTLVSCVPYFKVGASFTQTPGTSKRLQAKPGV